VSIPNCHWTDGTYIDLEKISEAVKAVNAFLVLDLSQSLGVLPINIEKIDPDYALTVGYKWLLGPLGMGYMYIAPRWQDSSEPLEYSWITRKGSDNFKELTTYTNDYRAGARKFDMGEFSQFNLMPMSIAGLKQITGWKIENIQSALAELTTLIAERLSLEKLERVGHIIGIPLADRDINTIKNKLSEKKIVVSFRGTSIRISPHLYNEAGDIDKLVECFC
jgi:selenocysteine lyase/cysteine desulfurase